MLTMRSLRSRRSVSICVLARAAEKTEAAALALQMRPGPNEPAFLIDEMGEFDLQAPFPRPRAFAEDLQDQPGAVEHLGVPRGLEIALLHGRERMVDDDELGVFHTDHAGEFLDFAGPEQGRGLWLRDRNRPALTHIEIDGEGKTDSLFEPRLRGTLRRVEPLSAGALA